MPTSEAAGWSYCFYIKAITPPAAAGEPVHKEHVSVTLEVDSEIVTARLNARVAREIAIQLLNEAQRCDNWVLQREVEERANS